MFDSPIETQLFPNTKLEIVDATLSTDVGPTGVTTAFPGATFVDLGSVNTRNVPHWFEISMAIAANAAAAMAWLLVEGPGGAPGTVVGQVAVWMDGVRPATLSGRLRFTPAIGTRNYHVRWLNLAAAATTFTIYAGSFYNANFSIREAAAI